MDNLARLNDPPATLKQHPKLRPREPTQEQKKNSFFNLPILPIYTPSNKTLTPFFSPHPNPSIFLLFPSTVDRVRPKLALQDSQESWSVMSSCRLISCSVDCHIGAGSIFAAAGSIFAAAGSGCRRGAAQRRGLQKRGKIDGEGEGRRSRLQQQKGAGSRRRGLLQARVQWQGGGVGLVAEERKD
ncbi:hypothetical protein SLEP1_g59576 [Rubroshorea leprosula]|uniref:Uncharacterized protein n=1 Tax=Rubroshorea leprosula TaxID=152421 RepID=A0AAV5MXA8_9ROSI|nr:hypothetical protein SLEP1_g59576 [Rubroshorea leprosula]